MKTYLILAAILVATWLGFAWALMIEVGVAHRDWWPLLPLMSYHVALVFAGIGVLFGLAVGIAQAIVKAA